MIGFEILAAVTGIVGILQSWKASSTQRNAATKEAAEALSDAVNATRTAIARGRETDAINYELTNLWHKASLRFRNAKEPGLSKLCRIKGNYWTDPANWTTDQIREADIGLEKMKHELTRILRKR